MVRWILVITALFFLLPEFVTFAADSQVAVITRKIGKVKLLKYPSVKRKGPSPHVKLDGLFYSVKKARKGHKLEIGDVIQTGKLARVRLIYDNGDQITVSPETSYKISLGVGKKKNKPVIDLFFGKLRAMVRKGGGRSGLEVRAKTGTMGVRGTDFFVSARGKDGGSEVSVLRGAVAVKPTGENVKPVEIPAGFSAALPKIEKEDNKIGKGKKKRRKKKKSGGIMGFSIKMKKTTKQDLVKIQQVTKVKKQKRKEGQKISAAELALEKKLKKLETKAVENTIQDIKEEDPELYEVIKKNPKKNLDDIDKIQTIATRKAFEKAPSAPKSQKPRKDSLNLDALGDDVYEKYFNLDD